MFPRTCVVLPAAGTGERMGLSTPKQYCNLLGRPLISYTVEAFEKVPWIEFIILVVSAEWKAFTSEILERFSHKRVLLVDGAKTRHRSIKLGVFAAQRACPLMEILLIHDAVRPFVDDSIIFEVTDAAMKEGSAGVTRPLVSTVVAVNSDGLLETALDRSKYRASEMPQAFRAELLLSAYNQCTDDDLDFGTECLDLVNKYEKNRARLLEGSSDLWKVTHRRDLYAAEGVLRETSNGVCVVFAESSVDQSDKIAKDLNGSVLDHSVLDGFSKALRLKYNHDVSIIRQSLAEYLAEQTKLAKFWSCTLFVHQDLVNPETVEHCTATALERSLKNYRTDGIIIHLILPGERPPFPDVNEKSLILNAIKRCEKLAADRRMIVNGVVLNAEDDRRKMLDVVSNLIYERNATYNGISFFL